MQQINPYLSKKPLAVGIKLIAKGFLSSLCCLFKNLFLHIQIIFQIIGGFLFKIFWSVYGIYWVVLRMLYIVLFLIALIFSR